MAPDWYNNCCLQPTVKDNNLVSGELLLFLLGEMKDIKLFTGGELVLPFINSEAVDVAKKLLELVTSHMKVKLQNMIFWRNAHFIGCS